MDKENLESIDMEISPTKSPPVSFAVQEAGYFPQVVTSPPAVSQSAPRFINRGINVIGLSSDRPTPKSLKEWDKHLKHQEIDDFCSNLINSVLE